MSVEGSLPTSVAPQRVLVREADLDLVGALDHVVVRDDVAGLVDHEAGAERLPRRGLLVERREPRGCPTRSSST